MVSDLAGLVAEELRERLESRSHPRWIQPMLAILEHEPFSDPGWIYERKLDGERCLAFRDDGEVRLLSRNAKPLNDTYPELEEAISAQPERDLVVDGEVVAFSGGVTSFSRLQGRMQIRDREEAGRSGIAVYLYLFDLLHLDGRSTEKLPLRERKRLLRRVVRFEHPLRFTPHRNQRGEDLLEDACRRGWEGLIAKDAQAPYVHDRSRRWLKLKCSARQELVVAGFTEPEGERIGFGALLLGYWEDDELRYAGRVGTGFDHETLQSMRRRMDELERDGPPLAREDAGDADGPGVHWVEPELVAEVGFTEWTGAGRLRHPRFLGLRRDKPAREVVRE